VDDVAPNGYAVDRATIRQSKTGRPVRFELTEVTRQALDDYLRESGLKAGQFLFLPYAPGGRTPAHQTSVDAPGAELNAHETDPLSSATLSPPIRSPRRRRMNIDDRLELVARPANGSASSGGGK